MDPNQFKLILDSLHSICIILFGVFLAICLKRK
jgi:hypothetical protein